MALYESRSIHSGDYATTVMVGGGVGGNVNITNIVVNGNTSLMGDLLALYAPIYNWHANSATEIWFESYFGENFTQSTFAKEYLDYVSKLKPVNDSTIKVLDMMNTAYAVINGKLAWSAMARMENQSLLSYAYQMILCVNDNSVDVFGKSKNATSQTIDQKIQTKYPQLVANKAYNIGGEVFIKETNRQFSAHAIIPPKLLGFKPIDLENTSALVNQILADRIKIHNVILHKKERLLIDFEVENLTNAPITFTIPKGQVFENLEYKCQTQNLASTQEHLFTLPPNARKQFSIEGWCLNRFFAYPNGGKGRITIYETIDKSIQSQGEQWQRIAENVQVVKENYPSLIPNAPLQPNLKENIVPETVKLPLEEISEPPLPLPPSPSILERISQSVIKWVEANGKKLIKLAQWIGVVLLLWFVYSLIVIWYYQ
jgi:hypothetical protein